MENQIEKPNMKFWLDQTLDFFFHVNLALCFMESSPMVNPNVKQFWYGLFFFRLLKSAVNLIAAFKKKDGIYSAQSLFTIIFCLTTWYGFMKDDYLLNTLASLAYTLIAMIVSLAIAAIFSNTAIKGYEVVVVCTVKGLSHVFRGICSTLLWLEFEKSLNNWSRVMLPWMIGCIAFWILGVAVLIHSLTRRNKDISKIESNRFRTNCRS
jgi:hypothetical protein